MSPMDATTRAAPRPFWIDVGGTFTDCITRDPDGALRTHKVLSSGVYKGAVGAGSTRAAIHDPRRRADPPRFFEGWTLRLSATGAGCRVSAFDAGSGILRLEPPLADDPRVGASYELTCGQPAPILGMRWLLGLAGQASLGAVDVRLGTTRGTNALLERRGARTALVTTRGLGDLLRIGHQARPRLFELNVRKPEPLLCESIEVIERVAADGRVLTPLDEADAAERLRAARQRGVQTLAICLLNSYCNPVHESRLADVARAIGFAHVAVSSELAPLQRIVPRAETTVVDAYLAPVIGAYVQSLRRELNAPDARLRLMTSAGGLVDADAFVAKDSVLSGPAAGVVGVAAVARAAGCAEVIGFDMGGTSTDVCRFDGAFERRHEMQLVDAATGGAIRVVAPMLAIETVAAGGGSICDFDGVLPTVGPRSAGADPGPACYGRGGPLCVTDCNVLLGRIPTEHFPFPLDRAAARARLEELIDRIGRSTGRRYEPGELLRGFLAIANLHMAAAIRRASVQRGHDPRRAALVAFGGAGGQHACAVARELGMRRILIHPQSSLLSAYGLGQAAIARFATRDLRCALAEDVIPQVERVLAELEDELRPALRREGLAEDQIAAPRRWLALHYSGQDSTLDVEAPRGADWRRAFEHAHRRLYGFAFAGRSVWVAAVRLELSSTTPSPRRAASVAERLLESAPRTAQVELDAGPCDAGVFDRTHLRPGDRLKGPALILEHGATVVVEPRWTARVLADGVLSIDRDDECDTPGGPAQTRPAGGDDSPDPVTLELFNHRFCAIAAQMGDTLQRTALSTNVKERLDFSCAVLDGGGDLVAHAPHVPVHLGALGACVKSLIEQALRPDRPELALRPGRVFITNDPDCGGSHLPDVTVITPVFDDAGRKLLFFVANRAHHAEIGGITPGSMPADSRTLDEEGVCIPFTAIDVSIDEAGDATLHDGPLRRLLTHAPYPTRAVEQNLADLHAQVAANQCGVRLLHELAGLCGLGPVRAYMQHIQNAAEQKMRAALRRLPAGVRRFEDALDDGTPMVVTVTVAGGQATVDFAGTGPVAAGNLNAAPAIVCSAVLYCLRCLIDEDVPLNEGMLKPVRIVVPIGLLNPGRAGAARPRPAVAGGNVETSQRIVDCIFGALGVVAASQGTMNNLTFGNAHLGYYETIGGGSGAGPGFDGADAVHTHMTNTRLTDPEVLEARYPVRLWEFAVRRGSGGSGRWRGGDGIVREIEFLEPLHVSILSQRRTRRPYGLAGGSAGAAGVNLCLRADGRVQQLGPLASVEVAPGDRIRIETPGGGGYGSGSSNRGQRQA